jgi:sulfite oxidase
MVYKKIGYAWSGGGRKIVRVDITCDQGKTWTTAKLDQEDAKHSRHWGWTLWTAEVAVPQNTKKVNVIKK